MLLNPCWYRSWAICSKRTTWSTISPGLKFFLSFNFPVAQNKQDKLQPTCEEMHAVILDEVGINTPSITSPSRVWKPHFTVRSLLTWVDWMFKRSMKKCSSRKRVNASPRLCISLKFVAWLFQSHCSNCLVRNAGKPFATSNLVISSAESDLILLRWLVMEPIDWASQALRALRYVRSCFYFQRVLTIQAVMAHSWKAVWIRFLEWKASPPKAGHWKQFPCPFHDSCR